MLTHHPSLPRRAPPQVAAGIRRRVKDLDNEITGVGPGTGSPGGGEGWLAGHVGSCPCLRIDGGRLAFLPGTLAHLAGSRGHRAP